MEGFSRVPFPSFLGLADSALLAVMAERRPGCEVPAWRGDVDHSTPFGPKLRGRTEKANRKSLRRTQERAANHTARNGNQPAPF